MGFGGFVTEDGNYLIISVWKGSDRKNQIFFKDLRNPTATVQELITGFDADYDFIGNDGSQFWVLTDLNAPQKRVIQIDLSQPQRDSWTTLIEESEHRIEGISNAGGRFIVQYLQDAQNRVYIFSEDGQPQSEVELPGVGSTNGFGGRRDASETFFSFTNYVTPPASIDTISKQVNPNYTNSLRWDLIHSCMKRSRFLSPVKTVQKSPCS